MVAKTNHAYPASRQASGRRAHCENCGRAEMKMHAGGGEEEKQNPHPPSAEAAAGFVMTRESKNAEGAYGAARLKPCPDERQNRTAKSGRATCGRR